MSLSDLGNLMCLPFEEVIPGEPTDVHQYLIQSTARLLTTEDRNWIPVLVKELGPDHYQVIGNSFIYAVAAEAGLTHLWCIIADDSPETLITARALAGESIPKTNLSTATRDDIATALDYLLNQPNSPLKGVNLATATARIDAAPRQYWQSLQPVTTLGCRITAGKKVKALEQVFYLTPAPLPAIIRDPNLLQSLTLKQLRDIAKQRKLAKSTSLTKAKLIDLLMIA